MRAQDMLVSVTLYKGTIIALTVSGEIWQWRKGRSNPEYWEWVRLFYGVEGNE